MPPLSATSQEHLPPLEPPRHPPGLPRLPKKHASIFKAAGNANEDNEGKLTPGTEECALGSNQTPNCP
jgi:hypothetical protein